MPRLSKKTAGILICKWTDCPLKGTPFEKTEELCHHVDECHISPCAQQDLFFCLWEGCKVYNKPSYSYRWLRRHTKEKHTKERPNKCLMNGCNMAFNSIEALQRHIMRHFKQTPSPPLSSEPLTTNMSPPNVRTIEGNSSVASALGPVAGVVESTEDSTSEIGSLSSSNSFQISKGIVSRVNPEAVLSTPLTASPVLGRKKHSLKVMIPRHCVSSSVAFNGAHLHNEVLDRKSMDVIRQTANVLATNDSGQPHPGLCVTVSAQIIGKRRRTLCVDQEDELLVRWRPRLLPDIWVPLSLYKDKRVVSYHELLPIYQAALAGSCLRFGSSLRRKNKIDPL